MVAVAAHPTLARLKWSLVTRVVEGNLGYVDAGGILHSHVAWTNPYATQEAVEEFSRVMLKEDKPHLQATWMAKTIGLFAPYLYPHEQPLADVAFTTLQRVRQFLWTATHRTAAINSSWVPSESPEDAARFLLTILARATKEEVSLVRRDLGILLACKDPWRVAVAKILDQYLTESFVTHGTLRVPLWDALKHDSTPYRHRLPLHTDIPYPGLLIRICHALTSGAISYEEASRLWKEKVQEWRSTIDQDSLPSQGTIRPELVRPGRNESRRSRNLAVAWMNLAYETEGVIYPRELVTWIDSDVVDGAATEWVRYHTSMPRHTRESEKDTAMTDTTKEAAQEPIVDIKAEAPKAADNSDVLRKYVEDLLSAQVSIALSIINGKRSREDGRRDLSAALRRNNLSEYSRPYPGVRVNSDVVKEWCYLAFTDVVGEIMADITSDSLIPLFKIASGSSVDKGLRAFIHETNARPDFRLIAALEGDQSFGGNLEYLVTRNNEALAPYEKNNSEISEYAAALAMKVAKGDLSILMAANWWVHRKLPYRYRDHLPEGAKPQDAAHFTAEVASAWTKIAQELQAKYDLYDFSLFDQFKYKWVPRESIRKAGEIAAKRPGETLKVETPPVVMTPDERDDALLITLMHELVRGSIDLAQATSSWWERSLNTTKADYSLKSDSVQFPHAEKAYELLLKIHEMGRDTRPLSAAIRRTVSQAVKDELQRDYGRILGLSAFTLETLEQFRWTQESLALRGAWDVHTGKFTLDEAVSRWMKIGLEKSVPDKSLAEVEMTLPFAITVAKMLLRLRKDGASTRWLNRAAGRFDGATITKAQMLADIPDAEHAAQWVALTPSELAAWNGWEAADLIRRMKAGTLTIPQAADLWVTRMNRAKPPHTPMMAAVVDFNDNESALCAARWWAQLTTMGETKEAKEAEAASMQWLTLKKADEAKVEAARDYAVDKWERSNKEALAKHEVDLMRLLLWDGSHKTSQDVSQVAERWGHRFGSDPPEVIEGTFRLTPQMVEFGFEMCLHFREGDGEDEYWVEALRTLIDREGADADIGKKLGEDYGEPLSVTHFDHARFKDIQRTRTLNAMRLALLVHQGKWTKEAAVKWWGMDHGATDLSVEGDIPDTVDFRRTCLNLAQDLFQAGVSNHWILKGWSGLGDIGSLEDVQTLPAKKSMGQVVKVTLQEDAKEIALRTGVKRIRSIAGDRLTTWWVRASNPRAGGETQDAWDARCRAAAASNKAFLTTETGQSLMAMVLGFTWSAAAGSIESDQVRAFGDMVARELRVSGGTDLLDGVLEEVLHPVLTQLPAEATNLRVMLTAGITGMGTDDGESTATLAPLMAQHR